MTVTYAAIEAGKPPDHEMTGSVRHPVAKESLGWLNFPGGPGSE